MIKTIARCIREYKKPTLLTMLFIILEAIIEAIIPFITANLVNSVKNGTDMASVLKTGGILLLMAAVSLCCGGIAGFTCAKASAGFSKNLRHDIFEKIQTFAFRNIDKFSSSSLVPNCSRYFIVDFEMALSEHIFPNKRAESNS